jgi:5-methylcytosine-specific restriction protein A
MPRPRLARVCGEPGCPRPSLDRGYCMEHAPTPWAGAERSPLKGARWAKLRAAVLRRDRGVCQRCGARATEVDHTIPRAEGGAVWDMANLKALCSPCHDTKTKAESARGRARTRG